VDGCSKGGVTGGRFEGRRVLVTGAASGLGRALAIAFAREGSDLVIVDVDRERLPETASMMAEKGVRCMSKNIDVSSREEMEGLAGEVISDWGGVDILVNNAGVGVGGELREIPLDDIEWIVGINLMGQVYATRLFLPLMIERGYGHVVNVASLSGLVLLPFHIPYTTTKFASRAFSEALWAETRRHGIGVTLVCPGPMKTNIMRNTRMHVSTERQAAGQRRWAALIERGGEEPESSARRVLDAVEKDRFLVLWGPGPRLLYYLSRLSPSLVRRSVAAVTALMGRS
jgi:short-subunit dehydrogenase